MYSRSRRTRSDVNVWPGFVDALASVLLVFIFMLLIFVVGQFFLTDILMGRNKELYQLHQELDVLSGDLVMERHKSATRLKRIGELDKNLRATSLERDRLDKDLRTTTQERDILDQKLQAALLEMEQLQKELELKLRNIASLQEDISALRTFRQELETRLANIALALEQKEKELKQASEQTAQDKLLIASKTDEIASKVDEIAQLEALRDKLRSQVAELTATLTLNRDELMAERDRSKALALKLSDEEERTRLAQVDIDKKDIRLQELRELLANVDQALADEKKLTAEKEKQLRQLLAQLAQRDDLLKLKDKELAKQVKDLDLKDEQLLLKWKQLAQTKSTLSMQRDEIEKLRAELKLSASQVNKQQTEVNRLTVALNRELASKVRELSRYRSEFFGRLRDVLGDHPDIRVVGDRFLFQSELLFASGSAELEGPGIQQLKKLAATFKTVTKKIPKDINWILRVDGHTDTNPINTEEFPSNWELSTARALSIVNFMVQEGIHPGRLAATGFGEFHPLDRGKTKAAFSRNRRIELKLTER